MTAIRPPLSRVCPSRTAFSAHPTWEDFRVLASSVRGGPGWRQVQKHDIYFSCLQVRRRKAAGRRVDGQYRADLVLGHPPDGGPPLRRGVRGAYRQCLTRRGSGDRARRGLGLLGEKAFHEVGMATGESKIRRSTAPISCSVLTVPAGRDHSTTETPPPSASRVNSAGSM